MRLDLFLKASHLCPRRTIAQKLCDAGLVSINGTAAKSAHSVKPGDELTLRRRDQVVRIRVLSLPATRQTSREQARALYDNLSNEPLTDACGS
jgi:ribosomal 50S subunit-recycling heat shock protein